MDAAARDELEGTLRRLFEARDLRAAAETAMRGYGPEIYGFLVAFHRNEDDAAEVYSRVSERMWGGLPSFGWQCSFRTWLYAIARNTSLRYRKEAQRRAHRQAPLPEGSQLSAIPQEARTDTRSFLKTENRDRVQALREALSEDDRAILVLRVDKKLSWNDLARIMHDDEAAPLDEEGLRREAARLRKRFQAIKERLLELRTQEAKDAASDAGKTKGESAGRDGGGA